MIIATAGHDTTSSSIAGRLEALLRHPDQLARLRDDPSLGPNAVEEMIRWVTPVKEFMRTATEDRTVGGQTIPAGNSVYLAYLSANRDEDVFNDPFRFDEGVPQSMTGIREGKVPSQAYGRPGAGRWPRQRPGRAGGTLVVMDDPHDGTDSKHQSHSFVAAPVEFGSSCWGRSSGGTASRRDRPAEIGQVVGGCPDVVGAQAANITRNSWLAAGLPKEVPATTVDSACGSSQQAFNLAAGRSVYFDWASLRRGLGARSTQRGSVLAGEQLEFGAAG